MKRCHSRSRRGAAAVELAVVLPLLLLLLMGVWEVGRLVEVQQLITNSAREAGRQASTGAKTTDQVIQAAKDYLARAGLTTTNVTVTVDNLTDSSRNDPTTAEQLDHYRVTVSIPFNDVRWIFLNQITSVTTIMGGAEWFSMKDVPLEISTTIPIE